MKVECFHSECKKYVKYGNYCFKHRNNHLLNEKGIIIKNFTNKIEDYYKKDLQCFYIKNIGNVNKLSKAELFEEIKKFIYMYKIVIIQSYFRGKQVRCRYIDKDCNNEEDFYTYEKLKDIPKEYFYTYIDSKNIKWGFDIRSLKKLIDMKYDNPYTTEKIPESIIHDVSEKITVLMKENYYKNLDNVIHEDKQTMIKHRIIDTCSTIERNGYTCMIEWIDILNRRKIKDLYRIFEDTINYRAQLSNEVKMRIYPPTGIFFSTPLIDVLNMNKDDILILILNEIDKFTKCNSDSDRKLGYMYFIISLSGVSMPCRDAHSDWINFIN